MVKVIPVIMTLVMMFAGGAMPIKEIEGELIGEQPQISAYEKTEVGTSEKPMVKPPRAETKEGTTLMSDGNYVVEGETPSVPQNNVTEQKPVLDADAIFEYRKDELDKRYAKMFELKNKLDEINKESEELWREYYAMRESYDKAYKRLVGLWAQESKEENK